MSKINLEGVGYLMSNETVTDNVKEIQVRIKQKKDTLANWETANPILLDGEMILVETPEGDMRTKVGNGVAAYNSLPFIDERFPKVTTSDEGKVLRVVNGKWIADTLPFSMIYTGTIEPANQLGDDGDLYMQVDSI
jgi:hypothetical protein